MLDAITIWMLEAGPGSPEQNIACLANVDVVGSGQRMDDFTDVFVGT